MAPGVFVVGGQPLGEVLADLVQFFPETFELITDAAQQFAGALSGSSSAAAACKAANDQWIQVLKRGGHLK